MTGKLCYSLRGALGTEVAPLSDAGRSPAAAAAVLRSQQALKRGAAARARAARRFAPGGRPSRAR